MKIKRIKKLKVNCYDFKVVWDDKGYGGNLSFSNKIIRIGTKDSTDAEIFMVVCHEVMETVAIEMNVRLRRPDSVPDYIFVYDHRQYETMMSMFSSLISQFIK